MEYLRKVDDRALLSFLCNQLAILNDDSHGTDVAGIIQYFLTNDANNGNCFQYFFQKISIVGSAFLCNVICNVM